MGVRNKDGQMGMGWDRRYAERKNQRIRGALASHIHIPHVGFPTVPVDGDENPLALWGIGVVYILYFSAVVSRYSWMGLHTY